MISTAAVRKQTLCSTRRRGDISKSDARRAHLSVWPEAPCRRFLVVPRHPDGVGDAVTIQIAPEILEVSPNRYLVMMGATGSVGNFAAQMAAITRCPRHSHCANRSTLNLSRLTL